MPAKPKLGQNFLTDAQAIQRIAASLGDLSLRTVIEVGPGAGAITATLAARAAHVVAVELDPSLAAHLRTQFPADRVTVIQQDVLTFDFAAASAAAGQPLLVFGNLPYGITTPILLKLAASHAALDCAVLMVQREVADRIAAPPGSRAYGLLSQNLQGGSVPGESYMGSQGNGYGYNNITFAENEEKSVWEPLHVQKGFKASDSAVSIFFGCRSTTF